jgi:hypothetical protein
MELRHGFIAHRDDTEKEFGFVYMRLTKEEIPHELTEYRIQSGKEMSPGELEPQRYLALVAHLLELVDEKIQKQSQKTHETFLEMFTPEEIILMRF